MTSTLRLCFVLGLLAVLSPAAAHAQVQLTHRPGDPSGANVCLSDTNGTLTDSFCQPPGTLTQTQFNSMTSNEVSMWMGSRNSCLTALSGYVRGSAVGLRACGSNPYQRFQIGNDGNFYAGANPQSTPLCLAPSGGSNQSGVPIILWDCTLQPDQMWSSKRVTVQNASSPPASVAPAPANPVSLTVNGGDFLSHNGSAFISGLNSSGQLLDGFGRPIPGGGTGNAFLSYSNGRLVASGAGNYTIFVNGAAVISTNGSNFGVLVDNQGNPYHLVASGAGNLQVYNASNQLVASGAGNLVASGAGNLVASGAGNLVASGAGNIIAATPNYAAQVAHLVGNDGGGLIAANGTSFDQVSLARLVASGAGNLVASGAGNVMGNSDGTYSLQSLSSGAKPIRYVNVPHSSNGRDQCLAVMNGNITNGTPMILWDCLSHDPSQTYFMGNDSMIHIGTPTGQYCLSAFDGLRAGSRVGSYQCVVGDPNQKFSLGQYRDIMTANGQFCVGVTNGANSPGSKLILWTCNRRGNDDQSWTVSPAQDASTPAPSVAPARANPNSLSVNSGDLSRIATNNGANIATNNGANIATNNGANIATNNGANIATNNGANIATNNGGNLIGDGASTYSLQGLSSGAKPVRYVNVPRSSNGRDQCLAVMNGSITNGSPMMLWDCLSHDPSQTYFMGNDSMIHIGTPTGQYCLSAFDGLRAGSRVGSYQCVVGDPNQKFSLGQYRDIMTANGQFCVGVTNGANSPGSKLILWTCNRRGNDDQSWTVSPAQ